MQIAEKLASQVIRLRWVLFSRRWLLIGILWVLAFVLGFVGFRKYALVTESYQTNLDAIYLALQLFVLQSGSVPGPKSWELEIARLLAPFVAGYTAILALAALFIEQFQSLRLHFMRHHVIICGLGRRGALLAKSFLENGYQVVAIEKDAESNAIKTCRQKGSIVLVGDATNPVLLEEAGISRAHYLIVVCDDNGTNVEIAAQARSLTLYRKGPPLYCLAKLRLKPTSYEAVVEFRR